MKAWKILMPVSLAAGVAAWLLMKKPLISAAITKEEGEDKKMPPAQPKQVQEGLYSFISGYQNAVTVELTVSYDPEKFSFAVISEEFLSYSSDSHVAVLYGEDYHLQIEYAAYYEGEDFAALAGSSEEKFKGFARVRYGDNEGFRYLDGDSFCFCFPVPGDGGSYVLVTAIRVQADPEDFALLPEDAAFAAMLASMRFALRR